MRTRTGVWLAALLSAFWLTGCFTAQQNTTLDEIAASAKLGQKSTSPYVEAYFEYAGPHEKWAGPPSLVVHVLAKDVGLADVSVSQDFEEEGRTIKRSLASAKALSTEVARGELTKLAEIIEELPQQQGGCLSPVRVRLVRLDGSIYEKQGCRTQAGWPGAVSRLVADYIPIGL